MVPLDNGEKVWRKKGEEFNPECIQKTVKCPASVIVWGCFSHTCMGCMKFVEKTLKSDDYQHILKDGLPPTIEEQYPESNAIFQQKIWCYAIDRKVPKNG